MNFSPIIHWELLQKSRRPYTYYARSISALFAVSISLGMLYAGLGGFFTPSIAGRNLFVALAYLGFGYVLFEGACLTADCLSEEKRLGTLGLLFLTDLTASDIVFGKLIGQSLNAFYSLLAALPATALCFFLGGVTPGDYLRMGLVLLNTLFFSLGFGMLTSALSRNERKALGAALMGVLVFAVVLPLVGYLLKSRTATATMPLAFVLPSPTGSFLAALDPGLTLFSPAYFGVSLWTTHAMGWGFFAAAILVLPRSWQDETLKSSSPSRPWWEGWRPRTKPESPHLEALFRSWLEWNPILWLTGRQDRLPVIFWCTLGLPGLVWLCGLLIYPHDWRRAEIFILMVLTTVVVHYALHFEIAAQACQAFAKDRQTGVLELLLTTPLGEEDIVRGRLLSLKRQFLKPALLVFMNDGVLLLVAWRGTDSWQKFALILAFLVFVGRQLTDMHALAWSGLWHGLVSRNAVGAFRRTVFVVLVKPWLYFLAAFAILGVLTQGKAYSLGTSAALALVMWLVIGFGINVELLGRVISKTQDDFRVTAAQVLEPGDRRKFWWPFGRRPLPHQS